MKRKNRAGHEVSLCEEKKLEKRGWCGGGGTVTYLY